MAKAIAEYLESDMQCEGLLECLHGLKALDRRCFEVIATADGTVTIDDLAEGLDRDRSTVFRATTRLVQVGVVTKSQVNFEEGGYYHVYSTNSTAEITGEMQRLLDDFYAKMEALVDEFEAKYEGELGSPDE